jgi:hypothetical protein
MNDNGESVTVESEGWMHSDMRARWMQRFHTARDRVQTFVIHNPMAAVGGALATGFLIARMFRR